MLGLDRFFRCRDVRADVVARYLGSRHYAAIYGALYGISSICTGLGAVLFGAAHDRLGLYRHVLPIFAAVLLGSGLSLLLLGPYVFPFTRTLQKRSESDAG